VSWRLARRGERGFTITELVVVCAVLSTLAAVTLPVAKFTTKRVREAELRSALRSVRNAIDEYKRYSDAGLIPIELGTEGYPAELEDLLEPIEIVGQIDKQIRFLRRIPLDPMIGEAEWGMRSTADDFDSSSWGGSNVFDVYSLSVRIGLNGIPYSEW
jgi:general secretion pathway protein G